MHLWLSYERLYQVMREQANKRSVKNPVLLCVKNAHRSTPSLLAAHQDVVRENHQFLLRSVFRVDGPV